MSGGRLAAADRLRRVLALIPYIAQRGEVSIAELAEAFGVPEGDIEGDLEVLPFCGLPPYTPDRLIDVAVVAGHVSIRFAEYFERPLRLTPAEGFALLAAGRALLEVPGSEPTGPLATALAKLEEALGAPEVVDVDMGRPEHLDALLRAAERRERLELDYYSLHRDVMTTRRVDPYAISSLRGHWYLAARCHEAGDDRLFRVDRIRGVRPTGEQFDPPGDAAPPADVFSPRPEDARVTLELERAARWIADTHPVEAVEETGDDRLRVVMAVSTLPFLERLLLQAGRHARVVEPESWVGTAAAAARRVLARYR